MPAHPRSLSRHWRGQSTGCCESHNCRRWPDRKWFRKTRGRLFLSATVNSPRVKRVGKDDEWRNASIVFCGDFRLSKTRPVPFSDLSPVPTSRGIVQERSTDPETTIRSVHFHSIFAPTHSINAIVPGNSRVARAAGRNARGLNSVASTPDADWKAAGERARAFRCHRRCRRRRNRRQRRQRRLEKIARARLYFQKLSTRSTSYWFHCEKSYLLYYFICIFCTRPLQSVVIKYKRF